MYRKIVQLDDLQPITRTARHNLLRTYLQVMEFVPGYQLGGIDSTLLETFLGPQDNLSSVGRKRLRQLGKMLGFDMFVHNSDRLPFAVSNRGNAGNIMFSSEESTFGDIIGVDNVAACINPHIHFDTLERYLTDVIAILKHLNGTPDKVSSQAARVRDAISEHTGYDIDAGLMGKNPTSVDIKKEYIPGSYEIQQGAIEFIQSLDKFSIDDIMKTREELIAMCLQEDTKYNTISGDDLVGLEMIREDYLRVMLALFKNRGDLKGLSLEEFIFENIKTSTNSSISSSSGLSQISISTSSSSSSSDSSLGPTSIFTSTSISSSDSSSSERSTQSST